MSDLGNKEIFSKNFKYYLESHHKSIPQVAKDLNIPYTTMLDWYNAKTYPRIDKIEKLANYFMILKSDLVEDKTKNIENNDKKLLLLPVLRKNFSWFTNLC